MTPTQTLAGRPSMTVAGRSIVDVLRSRARDTAERTAYTFLDNSGAGGEQVTYAELDERARTIGGWLRTRVPAGARILLLYPPCLEYITAFFGCLYAGVIAVPAYPPRRMRTQRGQTRLEMLAKDAGVELVLTSAGSLPKVKAFLASTMAGTKCHATTGLAPDFACDWRPPALDRDTIAFLQYTSGSTSDAKGVIVSHGNIMANEKMIQEACRHTSDSTFAGWLPVYHDMGLLGNVLQPLAIGARCVLMPPAAFLQKPVRWLRAISEYRAHTSGGPDFAYAQCTRKISDEECAGLDLSSWKVAFNGAERVHAETLDEFAERFARYGFRRESFYPCYGLAEATLMVSGGPPGAGALVHNSEASIVACGAVVPDTTVIIADADSRMRCPDGRVGEIWVSGPAVGRGYWNRPQQSEEQFRARLVGDHQHRFLRTGDLGFLQDGQLFVTGRLKDLIIVRGQNHHPEDLEWTARRCEMGLQFESVAAISVEQSNEEQVVVLIETDRRAGPRMEAIAPAVRGAIAAQHELQVSTVVLVDAGTLPKTSSGKIQRYLCRQAYLQGTLSVIATETLDKSRTGQPESEQPATVAHYLQSLVGRLLGTNDVAPDVPLVNMGLDSLAAVEAAHHIQSSLGVPVDMASLLTGVTIQDLAAWIVGQFDNLQPCGAGNSACRRLSGGVPESPIGLRPIANHPNVKGDPYPLSQGQKALSFVRQLDPNNPAYNVSRALEVTAPLDVEKLRWAIQRVIELHPQLRTTFLNDGTRWMQQHNAPASQALTEVDASSWTETELDDHLHLKANQPFDLEHGPVMRVTVYHRSDTRHVLLLSVHHIVGDLWSFGILLRQLTGLYASQSQDYAQPAAQYRDFVEWQTSTLTTEGERLWAFWKEQLAGEIAPLELTLDRPRPRQQTYRGARRQFHLGPNLTVALRRLGQTQGATLYSVLMAAFQIVLQRYSGADDFLVGTPVAGRGRAEFAGVVGNFINVLPIRARLRHDITFTEFLDQTRETAVRALAHQDYPFSLIVERLQPARDPSRPPLCQVLFALQRTPNDDDQLMAAMALQQQVQMTLGTLPVRFRELREPSVPFELILTMAEIGEDLHGTVEFNLDLFDESTVERLTGLLTALLTHVIREPQTLLSECPSLTESERSQILGAWNDSECRWNENTPLSLIERQVRLTPDAIAVAHGIEQHTYRDIDNQAGRLAALLSERGVGPECVIALMVTRSPRMVVALLAAMKAGAAFLPIDPEYPLRRIAFMLRDSGARLLLTDHDLPPLDIDGVECIRLDRQAPRNAASPTVDAHPDHLAYVIYTSGSTGAPKGVQVSNRGLHNFLSCMPARIGLDRESVVLASTSVSFDIAMLELLAPLTVGARVWIAERAEPANAMQLAARINEWQVTLMQATPTVWMLAAGACSGNDRLTVLCGGEALTPELAVRLQRCGRAVHNLYGPTETAIWSATHRVENADGVPSLGGPIANTRLYILDEEQNLAPVGVIGELYIGGSGVARGYAGRPALTAERFVPDSFSGLPGARLYKTGDRAYVNAEGLLYFAGRRDGQIKLHGVRIELREIEAALRAQPGVATAVVVLWPGETAQLAAYIVPEGPDTPTAAALYEGLSTLLPFSMLPASMTFLDTLPVTSSGKLDRKALPKPDPPSRGESLGPRRPIEQVLAVEWARVLGCTEIGIDENFFALGGHSLLATQLVWQLQDVFPTTAPLVVLLLKHPTVADFAAAIEQHTPAGVNLAKRVEALGRVQSMSDQQIEAELREPAIMSPVAEL